MATGDKRSVSVVGATGYGGAEAVRLLLDHPGFEVVRVTSERLAGRPLREACPWLATDLTLSEFDPNNPGAEFVVLCQGNGFAMKHARTVLQHARIVDLSADFRLKDIGAYSDWYKAEHTDPELACEAVYGLPEVTPHAAIAGAELVANPGCYPTAAIVALRPLVAAGLVGSTPVIDAKSGISGAGRSKSESDYLLAEAGDSFRAYAVTGHRHTPEIEQGIGGSRVKFTPHLLPIPRGIEETIYFESDASADAIRALWREAYAGQPFVEVAEGRWPSTKEVRGTNRVVLAAEKDERTGFAVLIAVEDNLVKGAAGQAVQNLNLMASYSQEIGLPLHGVWP